MNWGGVLATHFNIKWVVRTVPTQDTPIKQCIDGSFSILIKSVSIEEYTGLQMGCISVLRLPKIIFKSVGSV